MADSGSGGIGVLGVLIGALIVIVVGGGLLFATGNLGQEIIRPLKVELPRSERRNNYNACSCAVWACFSRKCGKRSLNNEPG